METQMTKSEELHYRPHGKTTVCGAMNAFFRTSDKAVGLRGAPLMTTDISRVTCTKCITYIYSVALRLNGDL